MDVSRFGHNSYNPSKASGPNQKVGNGGNLTLGQTMLFLKQTFLMQPKYPQKLTFNFIKQFSSEGQTISFNELNLRKCLTIRFK